MLSISQTNPTVAEVESFAGYLFEHGELRKLEAFRATYPDSKASNESGSVAASRIAGKPTIQLRLAEMQEQSRSVNDSAFIMGVQERKELLSNSAKRCGKDSDEGGVIDVRGMTAAIAEMNKMDGEYEKDNAQKQQPFVLTMNMGNKND